MRRDKIKVTALPNDKDALLQVRTGRADASFTQDAVGATTRATIGGGNQFEVANSEPMLPIPVGIVFAKEDTQLRDAFKAALEELIANGTYDEILAKNDLERRRQTRTPPSTAEPPDGTGHVIEHAPRPPARRPSGATAQPDQGDPGPPHWGQWVSAAVVLALVAALVYSVATNDNLQWSVVGSQLHRASVLRGCGSRSS